MVEVNLLTAKLISLAALGVGSLVFGFLPLRLRRHLGWGAAGSGRRRGRLFSSAVLSAAGGVLFATALVHILPESRDQLFHSKLDDDSSESVLFVGGFPLAEIALCAGFFAVYFVEELVNFLSAPRRSCLALQDEDFDDVDGVGGGGGGHHLQRTFSLRGSARGSGRSAPGSRSYAPGSRTNNASGGRRRQEAMGNTSFVNTVNGGGNTNSDSVDRSSSIVSTKTEDMSVAFNPKYAKASNSSSSNNGSSSTSADQNEQDKQLAMFPNYRLTPAGQEASNTNSVRGRLLWKEVVTVAALSLHGAFEGMAVGLEEDVKGVWTIMAGRD